MKWEMDTSEDDSSVPCDTTFLFERDVSVGDFTSTNLFLLLVGVGLDFNIEELNEFCFSDDSEFDDWREH
jgi:hypothetical protein